MTWMYKNIYGYAEVFANPFCPTYDFVSRSNNKHKNESEKIKQLK